MQFQSTNKIIHNYIRMMSHFIPFLPTTAIRVLLLLVQSEAQGFSRLTTSLLNGGVNNSEEVLRGGREKDRQNESIVFIFHINTDVHRHSLI